MVPELEKPRVTEIHVRMDCNGCVQKIKRVLSGINGIYDLYIDLPQQKLTIIGWADPEKIVKAIKKTRKIATICSHVEAPSEPLPAEQNEQQEPQPPKPEAEPAEATQPLAEATPTQTEPEKDQPPPTLENPPETTPSNPPADKNNINQNHNQQAHSSTTGPKDVGEVHVIHHHPPNYAHRYGPPYGYGYGYGYVQSYDGHGRWNHNYHNGPTFMHESHPPPPPPPPPIPSPIYVTHSYNTYRPSHYVTEYEYVRSPPRPTHYYNRMEEYRSSTGASGNIASIFSDENPNACTIA